MILLQCWWGDVNRGLSTSGRISQHLIPTSGGIIRRAEPRTLFATRNWSQSQTVSRIISSVPDNSVLRKRTPIVVNFWSTRSQAARPLPKLAWWRCYSNPALTPTRTASSHGCHREKDDERPELPGGADVPNRKPTADTVFQTLGFLRHRIVGRGPELEFCWGGAGCLETGKADCFCWFTCCGLWKNFGFEFLLADFFRHQFHSSHDPSPIDTTEKTPENHRTKSPTTTITVRCPCGRFLNLSNIVNLFPFLQCVYGSKSFAAIRNDESIFIV